MNKKLHLTLAQINPTVGDLDYNFEKICNAWNKTPDNTDLIVFPEMAVCGYPPEDLILKPSFLKAIEESIKKILQFSKNKKSSAIIPTPWILNKKTYNALHLIDNGKITATICKHHLPNYGVFDEARIFTPGPLPLPVDFRGFSLGLMLCEDMWHADVAAHLGKNGAELLIVPNASPYETTKAHDRFTCARDRIKETGMPLVYVNQVGGQDELVFDGGSFAMNESGAFILEGNKFTEENYHLLLEKNDGGAIFSDIHPGSRHYTREEEIYQALMLALRDYTGKNGFTGVLIGLSGGIDSALSATIAVDALGPAAVHGVMMPSIYTSQDSLEDAEALAINLGIKLETIPIKKIVDALHKSLSGHIAGAGGTTFENLQPRVRGALLMALSNASGKMLLSTGNKSEMAVGYATLYGDMCGGFNLLKDIYKTQVYALSQWRNKNHPFAAFGPSGPVIPERTITKAPTAELRENQTDQDTLPPYETLDSILEQIIEGERSLDEIVKLGHDRAIILNIQAMLDRAEYKRRQAPPGVKITRKAFGRDRRYPITNHFIKNMK